MPDTPGGYISALTSVGTTPNEVYKEQGLGRGLARMAGQYLVDPMVQFVQSGAKGVRGEQLNVGDLQNIQGGMMDVAGMNLAESMLNGVDPRVLRSFGAWHGGPHSFNKFKDKAIGSGEGAQYFGHGHYVTDSKGIGKSYSELGDAQKKIAYDGVVMDESTFDPKNLQHEIQLDITGDMKRYDVSASTAIDDIADSLAVRVDNIEATMRGYSDNPIQLERLGKIRDTINNKLVILDKFDPDKFTAEGGRNLYKTTVMPDQDPKDYAFMDWDKPINEQDPRVAEILKQEVEGKNMIFTPWEAADDMIDVGADVGDLTGRQIYKILGGPDESMQDATEVLLGAGLAGIKYPAGTLSGGVKKGTSNYVVFDPSNIRIDEHYINDIKQ